MLYLHDLPFLDNHRLLTGEEYQDLERALLDQVDLTFGSRGRRCGQGLQGERYQTRQHAILALKPDGLRHMLNVLKLTIVQDLSGQERPAE